MEPEFGISHHEENDWTVVEVHGEADVYTAPQIRDHVVDRITEGRLQIIIDLLGVRFMDSTGLGALVAIRTRLHGHGGEVRLVIASQQIRRIFALTGLHAVFPIYESVDLAKAAQ
ncbi:STAS domain-containing protein [Streptomyces sp. NPDC002619]|uniref:STAS domain-containing protein n=1 Tax=Streptomyces sp. NPDC002619 TaxID=3364655 RepID=UPI0036AF13E3